MKSVVALLCFFISAYACSQKIPVGADLNDNKYKIHRSSQPLAVLNGEEVKYEKILPMPSERLQTFSVLTSEIASPYL